MIAALFKIAEKFQYKYGSNMVETDLLPPPKSNDDDDDFYLDFRSNRIETICNFFPKLWAPEYDQEFKFYVRGAIQRGEEEIINKFGKIREAKQDIVLTLKRINVN